ncbi:MAG: bifunctional 5,10-methylenetetrahydrofolate dehydrogenase/5,10-methenyltetrahydrofolate cyclohydrolase [Candidatus Peribacter sp.]|jgi:methylenetetrahydrofolate dehydrogenase (NADP+) / methenyltetrahydrofolate cyclohydrolase|nr:bifunctional 5,10-methylenetetrahydrofolate dehydrogenase/5,10-methenyltetrahydrofolate cyclohydrolase [Candidatus Peribacter sp.]MBT4393500.1 bifunctional 5,10-methylenetetrahydrofolate dehydrogenase/5,10-methenyltetrahydrofolate cyclohydrolase [Candidatus Peribacter sp.]MBT4601283.1 bifunctional 5,10-methylenetetrahydrofolate dehydrogenase/5,10-methenyltetrahydrofolate cyclohydrolase [Candidatus Peribacter sp.]MBT5149332.1 bifunctional 5,10-methylenetetrahydrofolate dehydrogenase/5,10-methe
MSPLILDGKIASKALLDFLKPLVETLDPKLTVVQVGNDPASASYIKQKVKSCDSVGMRHEHRHLDENITIEELMEVIDGLNNDSDVTGFFVQLPLPAHLKSHEPDIIKAIDPMKDIDGFGAYNLGKVFLSKDFEHLPPATPSGIIRLLEHFDIEIAGKHAVVVGRSNTVGKPVAIMLLNRNATVTICHSKTADLAEQIKQADIVIAAVGKPKMITADMVKDGAVVVDVGIHRTDEGLSGDTDFEGLESKVSAISPVPGGVGPMTVASLIRNCVTAKERQMAIR